MSREQEILDGDSDVFLGLIDGVPDAVIVTREGQVVMANAMTEKLFGYTPQELLGLEVEALMPARFRSAHVAHRAGFADAPAQRPMGTALQLYGQKKDGREFPVDISLSPWPSGGRNVLVIIRDITRLKRLYDELEARSEALARSNRELESFACAASHDLKSPLRKIAMFAEKMQNSKDDPLSESQGEYLGRIARAATDMRALIDGLLEYARLGGGDTIGPVSSQAACEQALCNLQANISDAGANVHLDGLPEVQADFGQLVRLFQNLVGNGIKYQKAGQVPEVHVGATADGGEVVFSIKDNGIGIEEKYHERIFGLLERLHPKSSFPGTGIGLCACMKIVERHGGRIWLRSELGQGSTFFFSLPV